MSDLCVCLFADMQRVVDTTTEIKMKNEKSIFSKGKPSTYNEHNNICNELLSQNVRQDPKLQRPPCDSAAGTFWREPPTDKN
jgi:hypothetical protein